MNELEGDRAVFGKRLKQACLTCTVLKFQKDQKDN